MTVAELAALLRVSVKTIRRQIQTGDIPALKVGGQYRIPDDSVTALTYPAKEGTH
mgnify:FL=1